MVDLPGELMGPFFSIARMLTIAVEEAMGAEGTFVAVNNKVSQSVPHLHVHVVPRRRKDGLRGFFWPRNLYRDESHMEETANTLRAAVARIRSL
jgi:histidine triad (HIT) family protein